MSGAFVVPLVVVVVAIAAALAGGGVVALGARGRLRALRRDNAALAALSSPSAREERFAQLIEAVEDYAIFLVDPTGDVASWNAGAERGTGWHADEILGRPFDVFFTDGDRAAGRPRRDLDAAAREGVHRSEGMRVRKDGSQFVAAVTLTAMRGAGGAVAGFVSIARDVSVRRKQEAAFAALNVELQGRVAELAAANDELETFSYSVSHDLRGPLRAIDGFSKILVETLGPALDDQSRHYLERVRAGAARMGHLIDDLLSLARVHRLEMSRGDVDLGAMVRETVDELRRREPARRVDVAVAAGVSARADGRLLRAAIENLVGNAWKFTGKTEAPRIAFGCERRGDVEAYFVRDNGAGFDMSYAHKLFAPFQRLHAQSEFEGTGIGLATVHRIVTRHGGRLWAESTPGKGATFWFTLGA